MRARRWIGGAALAAALLAAAGGCARQKEAMAMESKSDAQPLVLVKPLEEWRRLLSPDRFAILFQEATERAFSNPLNAEKHKGTFICAACKQPLFKSDAKFESGTGWPSFFQPIPGAVAMKRDFKLILPRTEYHCSRCGGHQGHVFDDGPAPTGQRYCNNGLALEFVPDGQPLPEILK